MQPLDRSKCVLKRPAMLKRPASNDPPEPAEIDKPATQDQPTEHESSEDELQPLLDMPVPASVIEGDAVVIENSRIEPEPVVNEINLEPSPAKAARTSEPVEPVVLSNDIPLTIDSMRQYYWRTQGPKGPRSIF